MHGERWRLLVIGPASGPRYAIGQRTAARDEIARDSALRTTLPLFVLIPILLLVVGFLIRRIFRPVRRLALALDRREEHDLGAIADADLPSEIHPFVVAINRLLARVARSIQLQQRFVADAAHELRTPLTALTLQAERAEAAATPAETLERLGTLRLGLKRTRSLLDQLLILARAQAAGRDAAEPVSIQPVVREVLEELMPLADAKGIDLGMASASDEWIAASEVDLKTLLRNLVENAIRYSSSGGRVDLAVLRDAGRVVLLVDDSGPGIAEAERDRVFDPFYRVLGTAQAGSGLGLSIVRAIADRIGAQVSLSGSRLPAARAGLASPSCSCRAGKRDAPSCRRVGLKGWRRPHDAEPEPPMPAYLQALIDYFSAHLGQALAAVFAASLLEAFVVIGTFIPGSSVVFVAGALIGLGAIGLWPTLAIAVFGAILGDGISYWLGRHHHKRLRSLWPLRQHPQLLARGQAYFAEHGLASVFLGRFLSPTRAIVPVVAGIARMPPAPFYLMNVLSALAWAALQPAAGRAVRRVAGSRRAISSRLLVLLVAAVLLLWSLTFLLKFLYRQLWPRIGKLRNRLVDWARRARAGAAGRCVPARSAERQIARAAGRGPVAAGRRLAVPGDSGGCRLQGFVGHRRSGRVHDAAEAAHRMGRQPDGRRHRDRQRGRGDSRDRGRGNRVRREASLANPRLLARRDGVRAGAGLDSEATLARARPTAIYSGFEQFSFPSGHAASSIVLYGFLAFLLARAGPRSPNSSSRWRRR